MLAKISVSVKQLTPQLLFGLLVADEVYQLCGYELVVTSISDSVHSAGSLHPSGYAADLRTRDVPAPVQKAIVEKMKEYLDVEYDIVLEKDHIHLEWQPK